VLRPDFGGVRRIRPAAGDARGIWLTSRSFAIRRARIKRWHGERASRLTLFMIRASPRVWSAMRRSRRVGTGRRLPRLVGVPWSSLGRFDVADKTPPTGSGSRSARPRRGGISASAHQPSSAQRGDFSNFSKDPPNEIIRSFKKTVLVRPRFRYNLESNEV